MSNPHSDLCLLEQEREDPGPGNPFSDLAHWPRATRPSTWSDFLLSIFRIAARRPRTAHYADFRDTPEST